MDRLNAYFRLTLQPPVAGVIHGGQAKGDVALGRDQRHHVARFDRVVRRWQSNRQVITLQPVQIEEHFRLPGRLGCGQHDRQIQLPCVDRRALFDCPSQLCSSGQLGEFGVDRYVDNRWLERLGAAMLVSLINDSVQIIQNQPSPSDNSGQTNTILLPSTTANASKLAEKVRDSMINIPALIYQNQTASPASMWRAM